MRTGPRGERRPADAIGAANISQDFHSKLGRTRNVHAGIKVRAAKLSTAARWR